MAYEARQYVVFDAERFVPELAKQELTPEMVSDALWPLLEQSGKPISRDDYEVESVPLVTFVPADPEIEPPPFTPQAVFAVKSLSDKAAQNFRAATWAAIDGKDGELLEIGADPVVATDEFSCATLLDDDLMGTLDDARRLIGIAKLPPNATGQNVNVVIVDSGIDKTIVPPLQFKGGWHPGPGGPFPPPPQPGMTTGLAALHGMMVVNNILALAPAANIWDVPLIHPPKILDFPAFLHAAQAVFHKMQHDISWLKLHGYPGPWIFMNAWAIYDRRTETPFRGCYTENLGVNGNGVPPHPFVRRIDNISNAGFDIVFCAGNCGEVCPDDRCGPNDYGPGRGIWGANADRNVLSVGSVRIDGTWLGYSSEGPGPVPHLDHNKPDLCAPSQYVGTGGQYPPNTGTSAAAAVAAGVVAALRSVNPTLPPGALKNWLIANALPNTPPGWNRWLGNGIPQRSLSFRNLL